MKTNSLTETSKKISSAFGILCQVIFSIPNFSEAELKEFEEYISQQESMGFITDPTTYKQVLEKGGFDAARQRIKWLRTLQEIKLVVEKDLS